MKKKIIKVITLLLCLTTVLSSLYITTFALSWDGSSTGGGGNTTASAANGYGIRFSGDNLIGYRFSIVNKAGANKVSKVIDVFRNTTYGNYEYTNAYKFNTKYNKKQLINNQNAGYSTSKQLTNCYKEANCAFATALPVANGMSAWQNNTTNLNRVLALLGAGNISSLNNGDKILVEPIYDLKFKGAYHAVTVTETAIYGKYLLGASSDGGSSKNSGSWGFISEYTNKYYPNQLYTPDGQGLWTGVSAASKRLTFNNVINNGYGVGIAYTETKSDFTPVLSVNCCEAWPGSVSTRNNNHYGTSYGSTFANWTYGHGYPITESTIWYSVNFPAESQNCYVKQSVWVVGGGSTSRNVYSDSNTWYDVSLNPTTINNSTGYITVKAREDWIDTKGTVLKYGTEKTFYIPIKPIVAREEATAYAIDGSVQCYSNASSTVGKMYFGQRVSFKYKYSGSNAWTSSNRLVGQSYRWNGTMWDLIYKTGTGEDVRVDYAELSNTKSYIASSAIGTYTVPLNNKEDTNSYKMRFQFKTYWASDIAHTGQETNYYLPIVKSDVELDGIRFVDDNGYYMDKNNFIVGEHVTVHYIYKNNTDCQVFVKGYKNDKSQVPGIYVIPANSTIEVIGYDFTVPNQRRFNVWGGVYLENVECGNTSYETDGTNNALSVACRSNNPVTLTPIAPNAPYREGTNVITSFYANNKSSDNYVTSSNLKVRFTVKKQNGTVIKTETKNVVIPANDKNLVYFKWYVPSGLGGANVSVWAEIVEGEDSYNFCFNERATTPFTYYTVQDTHYEDKMPKGFRKSNAQKDTTTYTTWWEYTCSGTKFAKKYYGIGIAKNTPKETWSATGETATKSGSTWTMKSGYGISLKDANCMTGVVNYELPDYTRSFTTAQYAFALLPEFNYQFLENKCITLKAMPMESYVYWIFPNIKEVENVHYTPVWYPDGNYDVSVVQSDAWTPMGMLKCTDVISNIKISGNMYDDWYVGRK